MDTLSLLLQNDKVYQSQIETLGEIENNYSKLILSSEDKKVINDYALYLKKVYMRKCRLSYFAGMIDEENNRLK